MMRIHLSYFESSQNGAKMAPRRRRSPGAVLLWSLQVALSTTENLYLAAGKPEILTKLKLPSFIERFFSCTHPQSQIQNPFLWLVL